MSIEFRSALFGFNKDDVLSYVHMKDHELKALSAELGARIDQLQKQLDALRDEHLSALGTIGNLTHENDLLKIKAAEYDKKREELDTMSTKIGKLYLVSKSTAKTIVDKAEESSSAVAAQTEKSLESIENTQLSLKDIAEDILAASQSFVSQLDSLQTSLTEVKNKVSDNSGTAAHISEEFAELYAKLG